MKYFIFQTEIACACRENIKCLRTLLESGGVSQRGDKHGKQIRGKYQDKIQLQSNLTNTLPCAAALFVTTLSRILFLFLF